MRKALCLFVPVALLAAFGMAQQLPVVTALIGPGGGLGIPGRAVMGPVGGKEITLTIELSGPAVCNWGCGQYVNGHPAGGLLITISSSNPSIVQPPRGAGVVVPVGKTSQTFAMPTSSVAAATQVTISAQRQGSPAKSAVVTMHPPSLTGLTLDTTNVIGGGVVHGTAVFNAPPASAGVLSAKLSANNPSLVQMPPSVSVDLNKTVANFDIHTAGVAANTQLTLSAAQGDLTQTAVLTLAPSVLTTFVRADPCLCGPLTATINGAAPAGGLSIALSSSNPMAASVPNSVTIPAGTDSAVVDLRDHPTYSQQSATISATLNGITKKWNETIVRNVKADLYFHLVALQDRYGNAITRPADSQPYKMCVNFGLVGTRTDGNYQMPNGTTLHVSYTSPTGTGTSAGREFDIPISFSTGWQGTPPPDYPNKFYPPPTCIDLPGLPQAGAYTDVSLVINPSHNNPDESSFGNNAHKQRVTR